MENQNNTNDKDYIVIPNPIYDVVFKYLMEDNDSAKIILSTLINEEIIKLDFEPLSHSEKKETNIEIIEQRNILKETSLNYPQTKEDVRLFHLDFTATVKLPDGREELIMIELQKASEANDIFRFKRYLAKNFQKSITKKHINRRTKAVEDIEVPIRLIPIFILNFRIEYEINDLLIKTNRVKKGIFKNKILNKNNEFIDNLSYDIWVVQLPNLKEIEESGDYKESEYKEKLFRMLKIFDQTKYVGTNEHRLRLFRKIFPGYLDRVIKRLQSADINNPDLEDQMFAEDEYLSKLIKRDNEISQLGVLLDEKDEELGKKDEELGKKDEELGKKTEALKQEKLKAEQKDLLIKELQEQLENLNKK